MVSKRYRKVQLNLRLSQRNQSHIEQTSLERENFSFLGQRCLIEALELWMNQRDKQKLSANAKNFLYLG